MFKYFKRSLGLLLAIVMVGFFTPVVLAAGSTTLYMSGTSIGVGDTLSVDISATESSNLTIKYTSAILEFSSCSVNDYKTDGNAITVNAKDVTLKFKGASAGKANLIVTSDTQSGSSAAITVSDNGTTPVAEEDTEEPMDESAAEDEVAAAAMEALSEEAPADNGAAVATTMGAETYSADQGTGDYLINGIPYVLSERFTDEEILAGFSRTEVNIHDKTLNELSNGTMTLVYLKPEANTSGSGEFYIYDPTADTVTTLHLIGSAADYVMIMSPSELWNRNMTETPVTMPDGSTVNAYQVGGVTSEFYYIYGMDESGNIGWNVYDSATGTISRADVAVLSLTNTTTEQIVDGINEELEQEKEAESVAEKNARALKIYQNRKWILIGAFVLLVLIVVFINVRAWRKRKDREGDIFGDDYQDDDYDEEYEDEEYDEEYEEEEESYTQKTGPTIEFEFQNSDGSIETVEADKNGIVSAKAPVRQEEPVLPDIDISGIEIAPPADLDAGNIDQPVDQTQDIDLEDQMIASLQSVLADEVEQVQREEGQVQGIRNPVSKPAGFDPDTIEPEIIDFNDL